jgi:hypothetical protein
MKIWSPIACEVLFKLEDKTDNSIFVEVPASVESANEWVELSFDFSGAASDTYDKVVIFMDFATMDDNTFYFDDIMGPNFNPSGVNGNIYRTAELYPNPASEQIQVKGVRLIEKTEVYNIAGQLVIRQEGMQQAIDVSGLQAGLYTVVIEDQKGDLYLSKLIRK